jgi:hypothetical protein
LLSSFHDCIESPSGTTALERIPKRKYAFEVTGDKREFAWGLEAKYSISFLRMVIYHLLILGGTFAFWTWWQLGHPDDLQNASTPFATVAVLLSLFWSSSGTLKYFHGHS